MRSRDRQRHFERRALSGTLAVDRDPPAVQIDDTLDDREPQPGRSLARGRLGRKPLEAPEQAGNIFRREAGPLIPDLNDYTGLVAPHQEVDSAANRAVFDRVAHEIVDRLANTVGIDACRMIGRGGDCDRLALAGGELPIRFRDLLYEGGDVDWLAPDGDVEGIGNGVGDEIVDHLREPVRGVADVGELRLYVL